MSHATRVALFAVLMGMLFMLGLSVEYFITLHTLAVSNQHWCDTLSLLTQHKITPPANPAANPSRQGQYMLYQDFVHLKNQFGCER